LRREPFLHGREQGRVEDGLVIAPERLALINHFANVETVAQQIREGTNPEGAAADDAPIGAVRPGPRREATPRYTPAI
jgi:hypothetical protein